MAIVRHLVELHGGTVNADSAGENQGATFTIALPASLALEDEATALAEAPASAGRPAPIDELPQLDGITVLVVDDDTDSRNVLCQLLREPGRRRWRWPESTADAFDSLQTARPDVLISDIGMPEEDGYALIRRVRALASHEGATRRRLR